MIANSSLEEKNIIKDVGNFGGLKKEIDDTAIKIQEIFLD